MIKQELREADQCFSIEKARVLVQHIKGEIWYGDSSFSETLCALLIDRPDFNLQIEYRSQINHERIIDRVCSRLTAEVSDRLVFFTCSGVSYDKQKINDLMGQGNFAQLKDFGLYLESKGFSAELYTNQARRMAFVIMSPAANTVAASHYVQAAIPRLLPWFFKNHPLTTSETQLLASADKSYEDYVSAIKQLYIEKNIEEKIITKNLTNIRKGVAKRRLDHAREELNTLQNEYEETKSRYMALLNQIEEQSRSIYALEYEAEKAEDDNGLAELFLNNKNLTLDSADDEGIICFTGRTLLSNFDPDMFRRERTIFANYTVDNAFWYNKEKRLDFLEQIFKYNRISVRMMGRLVISPSGYVDVRQCKRLALEEDRLPNAHLEYFNCLGSNELYIAQCIRESDWYMAIIQCLGAIGSQNLLESSTAVKFYSDIFSTDKKIIELPDGTNVDTETAYKWLVDNKYIKEVSDDGQNGVHD